MSNPIKEPNFKNKRTDFQMVILLGAILDELIKLNAANEKPKREKKAE